MTDSQAQNTVPQTPSQIVYPSVRLYVITGIVLLLFWIAVSWLVANTYQSWKSEQTYLETRKSAEVITNGLYKRMTQTFSLLQAMPNIMSQNTATHDVLLRHHHHSKRLTHLNNKEILSHINDYPELQIVSEILKKLADSISVIDIFWLTDANGICIAASNFEHPQSFLGKDFTKLRHFSHALAGKSVVRYSMGYYRNIPGIFFSTPVFMNNKVAGVVTTKVSLNYLSQWLNEVNGLVIDNYGVIIYASDPSYVMQLLPDSTVYTLTPEERLLRYGKTEFQTLPFHQEKTDSADSLYRLNNESTPYYVSSVQLKNPDFQLLTLFKRASSQEILLQTFTYFALLFMAGSFLILGAIFLVYYIRYQRALRQTRLQQLISRDALTGFYNRSMLIPLMEQRISRAKQRQAIFAVLFVDIDLFKDINDSFGHEIGDEVLQQLAGRFKSVLRETDIIIRHAGDDFIILLDEISTQEDVANLASSLMVHSQQPFYLQNKITLTLSVSIGIVLFPDHGDTTSLLLRHADTALHYVKQNGRNNYAFYRSQMSTELLMRKSLESDMEHALENNEFFLVYQPQYCYAKKGMASCEALIRWRHPVHGIISPATFIPIAENSGFIKRLGEWILNEACRQAAEWQKLGMTLSVAVNLSAVQFQENLPATVQRIITQHGMVPHLLDLELTESILMKNVAQSLSLIQELKNLGARISLDDFGTGYSSLAYLQKFPIDTLKIDRAFVSDMENNASNRAIIHVIISMAQGLNYQVIAEGIETQEQYNLLMEMGCHIIQGYWFSKPLPADQFAEFYAKNRCQKE